MTAAQVRSLLLSNADSWGSAGSFGEGKLNIAEALGVTVPPISSVDIFGASEVEPNESCLWWSGVSGGTTPYSYQWYRNGSPVGTDDDVTLATGTSNFTLRLEVEDAYEQVAADTLPVTVTGSAWACSQSP